MRRVFRFKNSLSLAKIIISQQGIKLAYAPYDDRFPVREVKCASMEEALQDIFKASEQTDPFQCDFIYIDDYED